MAADLPPRISRLRDEVVTEIPCQKEAHRDKLRMLAFSSIIRIYVNYAHRFVIPRRRRVVHAPGFWDCDAAQMHREQINFIANEIGEGQDLNQRLSRQIRFRGYRPDRYDESGRFIGNKWWNKDFALNALGLHHLHLTKVQEKKGRQASVVLVFVEFTREQANFVMAGDHSDLDGPRLEQCVISLRAQNDAFLLNGIMAPTDGGYTSPQRIELAKAGLATVACADGKVILGADIANDGSSVYCSRQSARIMRALAQSDPLFDNQDWTREQFSRNAVHSPDLPQFEWWLQGANLIMYERITGAAFQIVEGRQGFAEATA